MIKAAPTVLPIIKHEHKFAVQRTYGANRWWDSHFFEHSHPVRYGVSHNHPLGGIEATYYEKDTHVTCD